MDHTTTRTYRRPVMYDGQRVNSLDGRAYRGRVLGRNPFGLTLERVIPKVRGKAARRADKRARQQARLRQAQAAAALFQEAR